MTLFKYIPNNIEFYLSYRDKIIEDFINKYGTTGTWLNLGSGSTNYGNNFINLDIVKEKSVNIIADGENLPFRNESFDGVINICVLEHTKNPVHILAEIERVLKPKGKVLIGIPFMDFYHAAPGTTLDHYRWTKDGCKLFIKSHLKEVDFGIMVGPATTFCRAWANMWGILFSKLRVDLYWPIYKLAALIISPFKFLDIWLNRSPLAHRAASSFYFIGEK